MPPTQISSSADVGLPPVSAETATAYLRPHIPVHSLLPNLNSVCRSLPIATASLAECHSLYLRLHWSCVSVGRLGERTVSTVQSFRHNTEKILQDITMVDELLHDDMYAAAHRLLRSATTATETLAKDCRSLALDFENTATSIQSTLKLAVEEKAAISNRAAALQGEISERKRSLNRAQQTYTKAEETIQEAQHLYQRAVKREEAAQLKGNIIQGAQVAAVVTSFMSSRPTSLGMVGVGGVSAVAATVDRELLRAREERAVHLRQKQDARQERLESALAMTEDRGKLEAMRGEAEISDSTIGKLEECITALRTLAGVLLNAETFWRQIKVHCHLGGDHSVLSVVESAMVLPEGERKAVWQSTTFHERVKALVTQWKALLSICDEGMTQLSDVRETMFADLICRESA